MPEFLATIRQPYGRRSAKRSRIDLDDGRDGSLIRHRGHPPLRARDYSGSTGRIFIIPGRAALSRTLFKFPGKRSRGPPGRMDAARTGLAGVRAPSHKHGGELARQDLRGSANDGAGKVRRPRAVAKKRGSDTGPIGSTKSFPGDGASGQSSVPATASLRVHIGATRLPAPFGWARRAKPAVQMKPGDRGIDHPARPATRSRSKRTRPALTLSRRSWGARRGTALAGSSGA